MSNTQLQKKKKKPQEKKAYELCEFKENISPMVVWKAVSLLAHNGDLFADSSIQIDTTWLDAMNKMDNENREFVTLTIYIELQSANSVIDNEDNNRTNQMII